MRIRMFLTILTAILLVVTAVPAKADGTEIGTFMPAAALSFTGGLTELHNSYGLVLGGHFSLARFGRVRFPVVGADAGFAYLCDPNAYTVVPGAQDPCGNRMAGLLQVRGGAEFILNRSAANTGTRMSFEETSLLIAPSYVVAGPLRGNWGVTIGIARRWGSSRFSDRK